MEVGIQVHNSPELNHIRQAGFTNIEISYEQMTSKQMISESYRQEMESLGIRAVGMFVTAAKLMATEQSFSEVLKKAADVQMEYIVVETEGFSSIGELWEALTAWITECKRLRIPVYLENSSSYDSMADTYEMIALVDEMNRQAGEECFGICLNIGHANLLGKNIAGMIRELNHRIKLIHANDNDGIHDSHQMPYTFTIGRGGALSTAWTFIIGALIKIRYEGRIIFDTHGLFSQTPKPLQVSMLSLLKALADEWEKQMRFECLLAQKKQIILFGAGNMLKNYKRAWGEKYPPVFAVDNNPKLWGEMREGILVKHPEAILEIPEKDRNVFICNIYYRQIEAQLEQMGINTVWYEEQYFM